jgi:acyl-CoA thioesterase FadM
MEDAETLELLSTMRSVTVYFDLQARKAIELPETIRQAAQARLVD